MDTLGLYSSPPKSRNWIVELLWPLFKDDVSAEMALRNGMYVCFACGLLSILSTLAAKQPIGGLFLLMFFVFVGAGVRAGSRTASLLAFGYYVAATIFSLIIGPVSLLSSPIIPLIAMGLLLGAVRASFFLVKWKRQRALSNEPPDLPESAFIEMAPEQLRNLARREGGFENALMKSWTILGPVSPILIGALWLLIVSLMAVATIVRPYVIPNSSMEPGLRNGDKVFALQTPFMRPVQRGDVVVFKMPTGLASISTKRVVGMPGDRIHLSGGQLFLNGSPVVEPYIQVSSLGNDDFPSPPLFLRFALPDPQMQTAREAMYRDLIHDGELTVPTGTYFVLGDSRSHSLDSRFYGPLPQQNVTARLLYVYAGAKVGTQPHPIPRYPLGSPH